MDKFEEMHFAKLDTDREERTGFPEVVFCEGKPDKYLVEIYKKLYEKDGCVFGTRASLDQFEKVKEYLPEVEYDEVSRILKSGAPKASGQADEAKGYIAVCTGGTADIPVAEEAAQTAEYFGARVERIYDVGVSGIHRVLSKKDLLVGADCVIAVAGMEGALASVVGGLADCPVIAVPTSVGYGASFGGLSALLSMLNSCASGVSVVNIDNGFGAGFLASMINQK